MPAFFVFTIYFWIETGMRESMKEDVTILFELYVLLENRPEKFLKIQNDINSEYLKLERREMS